MSARLMADLLVALHFAFIVFVVAGGFLTWRWPRTAWLHVPVALYGAAIEFGGWVCPLTPLENYFRARAGETGYPGGFIEHYIIPVIYPGELTPLIRYGLGAFVLGVNAVAYAGLYKKRGEGRGKREE